MSKTATTPHSIPDPVVAVAVAEHEEFHRFLAGRLGGVIEADEFLRQSLARALEKGGSLRPREPVVAWLHRVLRNALVDHFAGKKADARCVERVLNEFPVNGAGAIVRISAWDAAVRACLTRLLPELNPRYAEVIRRVDLEGGLKVIVANDLKRSGPQFDLVLHRARSALRRRLEVFCRAGGGENGGPKSTLELP